MRPILLKMSAFGPYAETIEIPMEKLGTQGLFLITGDTGAGKTTIFDAICFALFGEPSGNSRKSNMFRSKYAKADTPTEVELTFLHLGKEYRVKRNPEYFRPAKRGDGLTKQVQDAALHMPDGQVIYKFTEVTSAIENLLGINRDQFSQIAMLAQGDFLKLLLADTKQRQEIFRELFKTAPYQKLQFALDDKKKEIYGQVEDLKKSIKQYVSGISVDEDNVLSIEVNRAKNDLLTTKDILEIIMKLIEEDTESQKKLDAELNKIKEELEVVNGDIAISETLEKAKKDLAKAEESLAAEKPKEEEIRKSFSNAKKELINKEKLTNEAASIESTMTDYDSLDSSLDKISSEEKLLKKEEKALEKLVEEKETMSKEQKDLKEEHIKLNAAGEKLGKLSADLDKANERIEALEELADDLDDLAAANDELVRLQKKYAEDTDKFKSLAHKYEEMDQIYRDGIAGILAASLSDGGKCPVCGSTKHPEKAHLSKEVPTEKELKDAKQKSEKARATVSESGELAGIQKKAIEKTEADIKKKAKKLLKIDELDDIDVLIENETEKISQKIEELNSSILDETLKKERREKIEELLPEIENKLSDNGDKITESLSKISGHKATIESEKNKAEEIKKRLKFKSKADALSKVNELNGEAARLQNDYDNADNELKKQNEVITSLETQIKQTKKIIKESKDVDIYAIQNKKSSLDDKQELCIKESQNVVARLKANETIKKHLSKESKNLVELEKKLQWIQALADTANGKLKGKDKIMLETYIQTTYFDRIIDRANLRFMTMSGGQYELKRQGEASNVKSQSGLELGVIDHYNGSERSVRTLSGGESFIASLSLALGLSDEVQSSAGGIQIDSVFVDEGFGSLDPDTLQQAFAALNSLSDGNRLVGIISHVGELKERIDKQIVVTKEKSGGSKAELVI